MFVYRLYEKLNYLRHEYINLMISVSCELVGLNYIRIM